MGSPRRKVQVWIYARGPDGGLQFLVLLLRPERGAFWQPVTGTVEPGESDAQAADRESDEETGLAFEGTARAISYAFEFESRGERFHEAVFVREARWDLRSALKLDAREHVRGEWVASEDALTRVKFDSNREGLRLALGI